MQTEKITGVGKLGIIGLGYVGLPLSVEFGKIYDVVGYDHHAERVQQLRAGQDLTREVTSDALRAATGLSCTDDPDLLRDCNVYIVTVPTPVDTFHNPDLSFLEAASATVGSYLQPGDLVVYESTVYPGCTEEDCVPILEKQSGLRFNVDFFCGYSPERINPGDRERTLTTILKVVAGSPPAVTETLAQLYGSIITAGVYRAPSIRVAEAAKAIENAQRDINISFVNELALIFDRMNLDTTEVLEAAATKWNFLKFKPGLVGGHCIGVDPYYLVHKALSLGYHPQVISSGRRVNDSMGAFVAKKLLKALIALGLVLQKSRVLILGITFKENCPDIRNTKVVDVYQELRDFGLHVDVYDPWAVPAEVEREYGIRLLPTLDDETYDGVIVAVAHGEFRELPLETLRRSAQSIIFDTKAFYERSRVDLRL